MPSPSHIFYLFLIAKIVLSLTGTTSSGPTKQIFCTVISFCTHNLRDTNMYISICAVGPGTRAASMYYELNLIRKAIIYMDVY